MAVEGFEDALVASGLAGPAAVLSVGLELADVVELGAQGRGELVAGNEVVARLADVGVWAGVGSESKAGIGPGGARVVGNYMAKHISAPTWRVVWKNGQLNWPTGKDVQRVLLESEGVHFVAKKVDPAFILR